MTLLLVTLIALIGAAAVGLPLAWAMRDGSRSLTALVTDAALAGTVVIGLVMVAWTWFGRPGLLAAVVVTVVAELVAPLLARGRGASRALRVRPTDALWLVVLAAAFALRTDVSNNVLWTNDMGAYINWANQFARAEVWTASFPPLFPALLALPSRLGGPGITPLVLPAMGLLLVALVLRITGLMRLPWWARFAAAGVVTVSPHFIWFSTFNASEDLQTPLTVGLAVLLARMWTTRVSWRGAFPALAAVTFATSAALALNRGSALVTLVTFLVVAVACWAPSWRRRAAAVGWWTAASVAGIGVGWVYGVSRIPNYYVTLQLSEFVPQRVLDLLGRVHLLSGAGSAVAWALISAVVLGVSLLAGRRATRAAVPPSGSDDDARATPARRAPRALRLLAWPWPLGVAIAVAGVAVLVGLAAPGGEVRAILGRMGWAIPVVALLGLVLPRALRGVRGPVAVWAGVSAMVALTLHSLRLTQKAHLNYLYWDRYLVSEYLPLAIVLAAGGAAALAATLAGALRTVGGRRAVDLAVGAVTVAATAVLAVSWWPRTAELQDTGLYDGSYRFTAQLADLLPADRPVVWLSSDPARDVAQIFPNSVWPFGSAMTLTFGRAVLNRPSQSQPFGRDPAVGDGAVAPALSCSPDRTVSVVVWQPPGSEVTVPTGDLRWTESGRVTGRIAVLHQNVAPAGWQEISVQAVVYAVTGPADTATAACPS